MGLNKTPTPESADAGRPSPLVRVAEWISETSVSAPPHVRGSIRFVPPLPTFLRRHVVPPRVPWEWPQVRVPTSLQGPARSVTDPEIQEAALRENPLRTFGATFPLASAWTTRNIWRVRVPMLPRWLRATAHARATGRIVPTVTERALDATELTRRLRADAADLGISGMGVTHHDPRYSIPAFDPAVFGSTIVVCLLEQPWQATQEIPSVRAEIGALSTYTAAIDLTCRLAERLHAYGYRATAHDNAGPHLVIPYAVEAGLGQLGLNGQLLTPVAGSRCRVVCLSTTASLVEDSPIDYGVPSLCDACQACVERCPSGAIPNHRRMHRGVEKAKINTKRCLPVVAKAEGCAVCMKVCPVQRYGLQPVLDHLEATGEVMGRHTAELEEYEWPLTSERIGVGQRPRLRRDFFTIPGGEL
jgi:epoxyqueuosine reductase